LSWLRDGTLFMGMERKETSVRVVSGDEVSFTDEAQSIQRSALAGQSRS